MTGAGDPSVLVEQIGDDGRGERLFSVCTVFDGALKRVVLAYRDRVDTEHQDRRVASARRDGRMLDLRLAESTNAIESSYVGTVRWAYRTSDYPPWWACSALEQHLRIKVNRSRFRAGSVQKETP